MAVLARHLHTPIGEIEEMEIDRFSAYGAALNNILKAESGHPEARDVDLTGGRPTIRKQARAAFDAVFAEQRAREPR